MNESQWKTKRKYSVYKKGDDEGSELAVTIARCSSRMLALARLEELRGNEPRESAWGVAQ